MQNNQMLLKNEDLTDDIVEGQMIYSFVLNYVDNQHCKVFDSLTCNSYQKIIFKLYLQAEKVLNYKWHSLQLQGQSILVFQVLWWLNFKSNIILLQLLMSKKV